MKTCKECKQTLDDSNFYACQTGRDKKSTKCKECTRIANLAARRNRAQHYSDVQRRRSKMRVDTFRKWKSEQGCLFCSESEACCLDLHHKDPNTKEDAVANLAAKWSWDRLQKEIDKCVVVCRNCHAKIHEGLITLLDDSSRGD